MQLTKKLKAEILDIYETFLISLFYVDLQTYDAILDDHYRLIGTTDDEIFFNKKDAVDFLKSTGDQLAGNIQRRNSKIDIESIDDLILITDQNQVYVLLDQTWTYYGKCRISTLMQLKNGTWKIVQQHFSLPDTKAESGQTIGLEKIAKENLELKEAVKRRTIELEQKNKDLEIEASLERVRTIAMAMKQREDMLAICKEISNQLKNLGVQEIRNVQTAIFTVDRGTYMNYEFYAKHGKTVITETSYTNNKIHRAFAKKMLEGKGKISITHIKGAKKVKEWLAYQKTTNVFIDQFLSKASSLNYYWHSLGAVALGISTYVPLKREELDLFQRFLKVFELAYQRYLDIEKAEAQTREAQVETSLERVRSRSMAMQKSSELTGVVNVLYEQFKKLKITNQSTDIEIGFIDEQTGVATMWASSFNSNNSFAVFQMPFAKFPLVKDELKTYLATPIEKRKDLVVTQVYKGSAWKQFIQLFAQNRKSDESHLYKLPQWVTHNAYFSHGLLSLQGVHAYQQADVDVLSRFAKTFEQTYTRFLDLQKAEAQAREAQIEASLEKIRSASLIMKSSNELLNVIHEVTKQLTSLGFEFEGSNFAEILPDKSWYMWISTREENFPFKSHVPRIRHRLFQLLDQAKALNQNSYSFVLNKKETTAWKDHFRFKVQPLTQLPAFSPARYMELESSTHQAGSVFIYDHIIFVIYRINDQLFTRQENEIFARVGNVFNQAYTRFLDLQKAEAQARESQIEAALERVRSRSLAMHKSDELWEVVTVVFEKFQELNFSIDGAAFIGTFIEGSGYFNCWLAGNEGQPYPTILKVPYYDAPSIKDIWKAKESGVEFFSKSYSFEEKNLWLRYAFENTDLKIISDEFKNWILEQPCLTQPLAFGKNSFIGIHFHHEKILSEGEVDILKRFSKVFDQAYIRFLDLQKAEAQAREAQIEMALEKVRSTSLAMHRSDEIESVVKVLFEKLSDLGLEFDGATIHLFNNINQDITLWVAAKNVPVPITVHLPYEEQMMNNRIIADIWDCKNHGRNIMNQSYSGSAKEDYFNYVLRHNLMQDEMKHVILNAPTYTATFVATKNSLIGFDSWSNQLTNQEGYETLHRFARVFEQSYTRFLDLQKAEAQAHEAKIEAALERVRSSSLAMHKSDELRKIVKVVFEQLKALHFAIDGGAFIGIPDTTDHTFNLWVGDDHAEYPSFFKLSWHDTAVVKDIWDVSTANLDFLSKTYQKEEKNEWFRYAFKHTDFKTLPDKTKEWILSQDYLTQTFALTKHSGIGMQFHHQRIVTDSEVDILKRFSKVFEQGYVRFLDLQKAEAQAREAQIQLALERVRARTMAMHHSSELADTAFVLFEQIKELGFEIWSSGFCIWKPEINLEEAWMAAGRSMPIILLPFKEDPTHLAFYEASQHGALFYESELKEEALMKHYEWLLSQPSFKVIAEQNKNSGFILPHIQWKYAAFFKQGYLHLIATEPQHGINEISLRFAKVFEQAYIRFLDLQKAEAQARESQIQLALERVRARTMAMQNSNELAEVSFLLNKQVVELGILTRGCAFNIYNENDSTEWFSNLEGTLPTYKTPRENIFLKYYDAGQRGESILIEEYSGQKIKDHYRYLSSLNVLSEGNTTADKINQNIPDHQIDHVVYFKYGYLLFITLEPANESYEIFKRFTKEFEQTYTRFLDLQKAETQAREAQIQLALERVRARTMAMQKSDELSETSSVLFQQFNELGDGGDQISIGIFDEDEKGMKLYSTFHGNQWNRPARIEFSKHRVYQNIYFGWKNQKKHTITELTGKELQDLNQLKLDNPDYQVSENELAKDHWVVCTALFSNGVLSYASHTSPSAETISLLERFAQVFDLTYRRFLDLQKAEAQAREAQIQLALERVRARTMAMQKSDELPETSLLLFQQVKELGMTTVQNSIGIVNEQTGFVELSTTVHGHHLPRTVQVPINDPYVMAKAVAAWKAKSESLLLVFEGEELIKYNAHRNSFFEKKVDFPEDLWVVNVIFFSKGWLSFSGNKNISSETFDLLKRFGAVFEQTYTRFNDLKQVEEQARESQIEVSLERVRATSMAMHRSQDLNEVIKVVCEQLVHLGLKFDGTNFIKVMEDGSWQMWTINPAQKYPSLIYMPYKDIHSINILNATLEKDEEQIAVLFSKAEKDEFFQYFFSNTVARMTPEDRKAYVLNGSGWSLTIFVVKNIVLNIFNYDTIPFSDSDNAIVRRFAKVFEQSYIRFLDLQKAEAQAREAQIEAALEKVRSRTLAMQKSDELAETAAVMFKQLIHLGIEPNRLYIILFKDGTANTEAWLTDEDGSKVNIGFTADYSKNESLTKMYEGWNQKLKSLVIDMQGEELKNYFHYLHDELNVPFRGGLEQKRRIQHVAYFSHGLIGMASPDEQPAETIKILERFASVFNLTFTRFNDLKIAEANALQAEHDLIAIKEAKQKAEQAFTELQATQKQLIQSEKMASLGELTAGIAHEIQNPLNFVNNFSEVSTEILDEVKEEINKGNIQNAMIVVNDLKDNLTKINHHGKRASSIVKSMLEHSRKSSNEKTLTEINTICDEYVRLSYQGLRAKDSKFHCDYKLDLDPSLPKIAVIPQDISRVILNLVNNAFYACNERKLSVEERKQMLNQKSNNEHELGSPFPKDAVQGVRGKSTNVEDTSLLYPSPKMDTPNEYKPMVKVSTKNLGNKIEIRIQDNGPGIPNNIKDKIFQPFFTTKPTGHGTGLGLSLAYDIVKAHGGEIQINSTVDEENPNYIMKHEGTEFTILLPV